VRSYPARSVEFARGPVTLADMSESKKQSPDEVRDEVAAVVERARKAAQAIEDYSQEQADALVTAVTSASACSWE